MRKIDTKVNEYRVVTDIPGAFLHADMEDNMYMLLEGTVVEDICRIRPNNIQKTHMVQQTQPEHAATYSIQI